VPLTTAQIKELAAGCGFELAGIAAAAPSADFARFENWRAAGYAGEMRYLTDHRGDLRQAPRHLLPEAQTILCVGKLYNPPRPYSTEMQDTSCGWIARYAWTNDYHETMRRSLEELVAEMTRVNGAPFASRICVDSAPLLERSYARAAGLGWIGKNTCLINQQHGSWFLLAEVLLALPLSPDAPPPDRCGTCHRCIDACPTDALVPTPDGSWTLDARLCISYLTIVKRGTLPEKLQSRTANHIFGCDICQDVCPWNRQAEAAEEPFYSSAFAPPLEQFAGLTEEQFRLLFRRSPVWRARYEGFLRNVAAALGNSQDERMREPLERLAMHGNPVVAETARRALGSLLKDTHEANIPAPP